MNLSKKQVKALLEVISADDTRPVLTYAKIDIYNKKPVLVATDSYTMAVIALDDSMAKLVGQVVNRTELIKWTKLANAKDYLDDKQLATISETNDDIKYPEWQKLLGDLTPTLATTLNINAHYMSNLQTLAGLPGLKWTMHGALAPVIAYNNGSTYIVMPLKG